MKERIEEILKKNPFFSNMELAHELIFEDIIMGKYKDGERLPQEMLSSKYQMSRTPVRDALIRLEAEGYVKRDGSTGYRVSELDISDYIEFWEFRRYMESKAAMLAAAGITDIQLKELKKNLDRLRTLDMENEFLEVFQCDEEFHRIIVESCGNKYVAGVFDVYADKIRYYRYLYQRRGTTDMIYNGHFRIYKALEKHDIEETRKAMYQHMNMFMVQLRNRLKNQKSEDSI